MQNRERTMKPTSNRYEWYLERQRRESPVEYKTVFSRLVREKDMLRAWRTLDEIYMYPASTRLMYNQNSGKVHWKSYPELWEAWNSIHHPSVHWEMARLRHYNWWTMSDACNKPKWWRPTTYKK